MVNIKFSKKIIAILLAIGLATTIGLIIFFQLPQESNAKVEPAAPSYIANSKILLLSANSSYGYICGNPFSPCFIVRVTIRNDYTSQDPVDRLYNDSQGWAWFICMLNCMIRTAIRFNPKPISHQMVTQIQISKAWLAMKQKH